MSHPIMIGTGALALAFALSGSAFALDPEFEALRAAARKHEAQAASAPKPATPAKPTGPSLAGFVPAAPRGWRLINNPNDDAEGLVDLTQQASGRYAPSSGAAGQSVEITILAKSDLIGGGIPQLGRDAYSGTEISEVSIGGKIGYLSWQAATGAGQLTFSVGRYQIIVAGRQTTPSMLNQFAAAIDRVRLEAA